MVMIARSIAVALTLAVILIVLLISFFVVPRLLPLPERLDRAGLSSPEPSPF